MNAQHIYMVGIGGIGMSARAQLLTRQGKVVSGSDRSESPTTELLTKQGIEVSVGHDQCLIPADTELLIYSDAVPESNVERARAREMGIPEMSYFEALGDVSKKARTIAVAGTHGKTTTTGMLAKILQYCDKEPTAVIGSIVRDFESNFLPGRDELFVVEACEYRDHMLKIAPEILVITNIELDHTDYFPNLKALQDSFRKMAEKIPVHGAIVTNPYDPIIAGAIATAKAPILDYTTQTVPELAQIGEFNRENARAAKCAARAAFPHLQEEFTDKALLEFKGSWRRFEYRGETPSGATVFDDYAHHPTAIEKTIAAARERFPGKRITVAFHPHTYTRTASLMDEFARALAQADRTIIAPIFAAREEPIEGITSEALAAQAQALGGNVTAMQSFDEIRDALLKEGSDALIITMGAGDIYKVAEEIAD